MLDLRNMTYNGTAVAYATLPMYMLNAALQQDTLTPAAKLVFVRLMAYASAVHTNTFAITVAWVAKNTGLCRKTAARALALLSDQGYVNDSGIVFTAPPEKTKRTTQHHFPNATKMIEPDITPADIEIDLGIDLEAGLGIDLNVDCDIDQLPNPSLDIDLTLDETTDIGGQLNDLLRSLGSTKKVDQKVHMDKKAVHMDGKNDVKRVDKMSHAVGKNVPTMGKNVPPIITIPNKQSEIKHSSTPSVTVGVLPVAKAKGFVESTKPKSLATMLQGFTTGKPKPALHGKHSAYIETALVRMKVTSPSERARYQSEIAYAATQGAFAETFSHTPLKAIRACLNLVEAGRWKANAGMYA